MFVDQAGFDYHLTAGSPAIGKGVAPGSADSFSLCPPGVRAAPRQRRAQRRRQGGRCLRVRHDHGHGRVELHHDGRRREREREHDRRRRGRRIRSRDRQHDGDQRRVDGRRDRRLDAAERVSVGSDPAGASGVPVAVLAALAWMARRRRASR